MCRTLQHRPSARRESIPLECRGVCVWRHAKPPQLCWGVYFCKRLAITIMRKSPGACGGTSPRLQVHACWHMLNPPSFSQVAGEGTGTPCLNRRHHTGRWAGQDMSGHVMEPPATPRCLIDMSRVCGLDLYLHSKPARTGVWQRPLGPSGAPAESSGPLPVQVELLMDGIVGTFLWQVTRVVPIWSDRGCRQRRKEFTK